MKPFSIFCAVLCTVSTLIVCIFTMSNPDPIRGEDVPFVLEAVEGNTEYGLTIEGLHFINSTPEIRITVVPTDMSVPARVEALYSEDLHKYNFSISIIDEEIKISMDSDYAHPIKTLDIHVYANVHTVISNGRGFSLAVDTGIMEAFNMYVTGTISADVSLPKTSAVSFVIAGDSTMQLSGLSDVANINIAGNVNIYGMKFVTESAVVSATGTSTVALSVSRNISASLKGQSSLEYFGSPSVNETVDSESKVVQISPLVAPSL